MRQRNRTTRNRTSPECIVTTFAGITPVGPRLVGRIVADQHEGVRWHRVIRATGTAPTGAARLQRLRQKGVPLTGDRVEVGHARVLGAQRRAMAAHDSRRVR